MIARADSAWPIYVPAMLRHRLAFGLSVAIALVTGCAPNNPGVPGSPAVTHPRLDGTIFTIVFENENADRVLVPENANFYALSQTYGRADAYVTAVHPSLANYIVMTSGETHGITASDDPATNVAIEGSDNLADQLDGGGVPWRAYMESMGEPCRMESREPYRANHDPFLYYTSMASDPARCAEHVVDFDERFAEDLASDAYRFMWITPNQCHNGHNCPMASADAFLGEVLEQILASPGYRAGGAIFILFDEGHLRILDAGANIPAIVVSDRLVLPGYVTDTRFDHRSYLATIEDIFGLDRLPTTVDATPLGEFFEQREPTDGHGATP